MIKMQKIYKRGALESRCARSFMLGACAGTTLIIFLTLLNLLQYTPLALLAALLLGSFCFKLDKPYEINANAMEMVGVLALNALILLVLLFLVR